ncbi:MAG: hypothetical protein JXR65_08650, partial [Bacteroidales bacterium]|nr:hypothetical protein [Bacteroidales bacterium]
CKRAKHKCFTQFQILPVRINQLFQFGIGCVELFGRVNFDVSKQHCKHIPAQLLPHCGKTFVRHARPL